MTFATASSCSLVPQARRAAAHALQKEGLTSPFDAVRLAEAMHRDAMLVTADERLWRTRLPTKPY